MSHMTIRRDVSKLEEQGLLVSVSGAAYAPSAGWLAAEPSHLVKSTLQSEEKQAIGALAASHIAKNSCIYLDAGTTTPALARAILDRNDLQVVTNDFEINPAADRCQPVRRDPHRRHSVPGEPLLRGRIGGAYVTPPGYRYGLYLRQRLGQSRDIHP